MDSPTPNDLPILAYKAEILSALRKNPAIIVCGDTGSGKTTRLPLFALDDGQKRIVCTQPRRLAALTVATRTAEAFNETPGGIVGYRHRFEKKVSERTCISFVTDGVLLSETRRDPLLRAYDTIIIDEAHERSLNIDFLLGLLKRILTKRRDLKVIVSSATLDAERFAEFFGGAPIITIPGRLFPIEVRYEPSEDDEPDIPQAVAQALEKLPPNADTLVFLSGERDIRETAELLASRRLFNTEIIPLLASLPAGEQQRAFKVSSMRRVILATNVAETSVTIPNIRAVIDSGLARVNRYVPRTQVQRLQIEAISQASANQRKGRCGRVAPGICVRLYAEEDFLERPEYADPEILRTSLAGAILTMLDLRVGQIEDFPFLDPPPRAMVRSALRELQELGALRINDAGELVMTGVGRELARIPLEPRYGRILLAAKTNGSFEDALVVVAALAGEDPWRRPIDKREQADAARAEFRTPESDFAAILKLWRWWDKQTKTKSQSALRKLCKDKFLSFSKMREWRDLQSQLRRLCGAPQKVGGTCDNSALSKALLAGLLGRIGKAAPEGGFRGANGLRFGVFTGSALAKKKSEWIMAGELVDTSRLLARTVAEINPDWIEAVAGDLCKRTYYSPAWDAERGFVSASERVILYGLTIAEGRRRDYGRIEPLEARTIFIRDGLLTGAFPKPPPQLRENFRAVAKVREEEEKTRVAGLLDEERLFDFYDEKIPKGINNADALRRWMHDHAAELRLPRTLLRREKAAGFPDSISIAGARLRLSYKNDADAEDDGITCTVREKDLSALANWRSDWLVPGALPPKIHWMLSLLTSSQRRALAPLDDAVTRCASQLNPSCGLPLAEALADFLSAEFGIKVAADFWREKKLPPHLAVYFRVIDERGKTLKCWRDAGLVQEKSAAKTNLPAATRAFTDEPLPAEVQVGEAGWPVMNYPALVAAGDDVTVRLFANRDEARAAHLRGAAHLIALLLGKEARELKKAPRVSIWGKAFLQNVNYELSAFSEDFAEAVIVATFIEDLPELRSRAEFSARIAERRGELFAKREHFSKLLAEILDSAAALWSRISESNLAAAAEIAGQLAWLVFPGFVRVISEKHLRHFRRYISAMELRLERAEMRPDADARKAAEVADFWNDYSALLKKRCDRGLLDEFRWLIEEFRVSLFAQELGTALRVSAKRLDEVRRKLS